MFYSVVFFILLISGIAQGSPVQNVNEYIEVNPYIYGGVQAPAGYAPHMVALVFGAVLKSLQCGGSIVSTSHILTAAHCIEPLVVWGELIPSLEGVLGSNNWNTGSLRVRFTTYMNHPNWDNVQIKNDIGVLFLEDTLKLSNRVAVVPLSFEHVDTNEESSVTGWGMNEKGEAPDFLSLLYLSVLPSKQCERIIHEETANWWSPPAFDPAVEICTFHSFGHGMCFGDSGSALVARKTRHQIGIVSWGFPCAIGMPDIFVRVSAYEKFLQPILSNSFPK